MFIMYMYNDHVILVCTCDHVYMHCSTSNLNKMLLIIENFNCYLILPLILIILILIHMENKCAICEDEVFASCHCENCEGNGPLLCYQHFVHGPCPLEELNKPKEESSLMPKKEDFLSEVIKESKNNSFILLPETKAAIIDELKSAENVKSSKTRYQYRLLRRYKLIRNGEKENF